MNVYVRSWLNVVNLRLISLAGRLTLWAYGSILPKGEGEGSILLITLSIIFLGLGQIAATEGILTQLFFLMISASVLILAMGIVFAFLLVLVYRFSKRITGITRFLGIPARRATVGVILL